MNVFEKLGVDFGELGFDPERLRAKYRQERDKRVRTDGNNQYQQVVGDFSRYVDDPYAASDSEREPLHDHVDVAVIGGGFGGLLAGARLRETGVERIRLIEKGSDFGGTWYWNRYPGAMCDVESYIYLPLLEELSYFPIEKYTHAPEILAHCRRIAEHFDLYSDACLQTEVTEVRWDDSNEHWIISTNRDDLFSAKTVIMSNGPLNRPKLPAIAGINKFKGHTFHTSRWDYSYTGGNSSGSLEGLAGKRVGIIGTGATAVQCIPHLGEAAEKLFVFQRTPSSIDVRGNKPTDSDWAASQQSGWQKHRMENFTNLTSGGMGAEDLVGDGWTEIYRNLTGMLPPKDFEELSKENMSLATELADFKKMEKIRARVDSIVHDKKTAESLKPYYRQFCKRPCFHDEYLDTYNRPNVHLVDTEGRGVDEITETGVMVDGVHYELDCLIFATGFEVGTDYTRRSGYDVIGREGLSLSSKWADGPSTFHGYCTNGFPNCYFMGMVHSALTTNFCHLLDEQSKHLAHLVAYEKENGVNLETTLAAEEEWGATIKKLARVGERFFAECTPGYYNSEGKVDKKNGFLSNVYGGGPLAFFEILKDWRESDGVAGLVKK